MTVVNELDEALHCLDVAKHSKTLSCPPLPVLLLDKSADKNCRRT